MRIFQSLAPISKILTCSNRTNHFKFNVLIFSRPEKANLATKIVRCTFVGLNVHVSKDLFFPRIKIGFAVFLDDGNTNMIVRSSQMLFGGPQVLFDRLEVYFPHIRAMKTTLSRYPFFVPWCIALVCFMVIYNQLDYISPRSELLQSEIVIDILYFAISITNKIHFNPAHIRQLE